MAAVSEQCLAPSRLVPVTAATSPDPACLLLPAIGLDSADTPRDVIDALILAAFTEGSRPFARTARLQEVRRGFARTVRAPAWLDIRMNYGSATAAALDQLMAVTPDDLAGQLLLLYGPPGTGKTTALRALARERQRWCETDCVLDPEALFADPGYLMEAALGDDETPGEGRWRLLLLEDCDELISADAKRASGQALSRLLNLTDGLLGQGRRVLVAITTNEDIRSLHPAVVRPGRCLAQIEVGPLAAAEAAAWLGAGGDVASPLTLADLYARRRAGAPISSALPPARVGPYL
jgi:ATPase family associated with various cellular activities (AAA)/Domain of unknown function (DUF5925)